MAIRTHRRLLARIALALLFFTQGVMAWSACDWLQNSPERAVLAAAEVAPCHESGFGGACLTHCLSDRQAVQKVTMDVPAMPSAPVLTLALAPEASAEPLPTADSEAAVATGPPRRILLQSFQL